tara:strand:- start:1675 stop:1884 length:210 start_codon:yes stop_codon:yes gene_type:complete
MQSENIQIIILDEHENPVFLNVVESGIIVSGPHADPYFMPTSQPWLIIDALIMERNTIRTAMPPPQGVY